MAIAGRSTHTRSKIPSAVKIMFLVFSERFSGFCIGSIGSKQTKICGDDDDDDAFVSFA